MSDDNDVHFVLEQHAKFDFYSASTLEQHAACLVEKLKNTNFVVFSLTHQGLKPMIYCIQGEYAIHYTINVVNYGSD